MLEILVLGFFLGMSHALEPDHVAAVGAMTLKKGSSWKSLLHGGLFWGGGHTLMLLLICGVVISLNIVLADSVAALLEAGVGVMLVLLGLNVFHQLRRQSLHLHVHEHDNGRKHLHFHTHPASARAAGAHRDTPHQHRHQPLRMMLIGLMHGAAGSASLLTLTVAITHSAIQALAYVVVFGVGSMLGMGLLTGIAAWPLGFVERRWTGVIDAVSIGSGMLAVGLGLYVIYENLGALAVPA